MMKDYHTHQCLLHVFIVTMLSEITSTSVEPNLTLSNNSTLAVSSSARIDGPFDQTTYAYMITNPASLSMTTNTINGMSSTTVAAASTSEDSSNTNSASTPAIEYELSVFFDALTTDNTAVLFVTTNTLSNTFMIDSTAVFPLTKTILSTNQMNSITLLSATTTIYSTNGDTTVVNRPSIIPSEQSSSSSFSTAAIVGVTVGVFILIAILLMTVMVMCIVVRRKRNKRKYRIDSILQDAVIENDAVIYRDKQHRANDGISNAYEITELKFNNPDLSYVKPNTSPNVIDYEIPNSVDRVYADPGNKEDMIYNWLESNGVCKINLDDIEFHRKIGSGHFGVVSLGLWSNDSTDPVQVAVKTLNSQCSESDRVKFLREAAIMGQFVHNNVVQLHGVVTEEENVMIVLEYMPKGDLKNLLTNLQANDKLPEVLLNFCRQIAAGMNYLANKQFVHRDLAARNVLVSSDDVCKIADFGMARDLVDGIYYITSGDRKVPLKWTAPEAIMYNKYSTKSDVWSFGCIIYEVWSLGHNPFENVCMKEFINNIKNGQRLPPPPGCSRALYELMMECWHPEAMERPKPMMILNRLNELDVTQLHSDDEELTNLGDPLTASEQLYIDLQDLYITNNDYLVISA